MILKLVTFNIAHGKGMDGIIDIKRQTEIIKQYKPDIIFLQEIDMFTKRVNYQNEIREFCRGVNLKYSSMESNINLQEGYYGDGIISRFPMSFSTNYLMPITSTEHEARSILYNRISFGTTKLNLFSVHLSTYPDERILAVKKFLTILKQIDPNEIIIVGGDFNVGKDRLGKGNYTFDEQDTYEEYELLKMMLNKIDNNEPTWFSKTTKGCIDTIFYSDNVELLKFKTIQTNGTSDHNAVYAEFDI